MRTGILIVCLLGRHLFYDQRLSVNNTQSCASCHQQQLAFTDGRAVSVGATGEPHSRSAMSLVNVASSGVLTWSNPDLHSLEEQALIPMFGEHPVELGMHGREQELLARLRTVPVYRDLFAKAFPGPGDPFTVGHVTQALAAFERSIVSARSPYDRYHAGDAKAVSDAVKRGEAVFFTDYEGSCFRCHSGPNFTDSSFHNTALYKVYPASNLGIFEHTRRPEDAGKFKAPPLRNIALTAPYMHDGSIATLEAVIEHYAAGGRASTNPHRDPRMAMIAMTPQNKRDLLEFLRSLTDTDLLHDPRFANPW
ncbi:MAG TPA: di-heme enzyme [Candidatus Sulfopaludibacter sp.]|nr:di-heme enzyme [Candidatus Sulfopaludibacter sp.]